MANKKRILYVRTSGADTPKRLYSPFVLLTTAKAMDIDATIHFLGLGITVVKKGMAKTVKESEFPTLTEIMDQAVQAGMNLMVCEQGARLLRLNRGEVVPEAEIAGAAISRTGNSCLTRGKMLRGRPALRSR